MKAKKLLTIAALLTASLSVQSESLLLGGWSNHFEDGDFNEQNNLIAAEYKDVTVGTFKNSFYNQTHFIGYDFNHDTKYFKFGAITGASKGYEKGDLGGFMDKLILGDDFMPMIVPYIQINTPYVKPVLGLLGEAVFLTFRVEFK